MRTWTTAAVVIQLLAGAATSRAAEPPATVALPAPRLEGSTSVEAALQQRRSLRTPSPAALTLAQVGQLCWAAQGVTDARGHRTTPSAHAVYPLQLYVVAGAVEGLAPGLYRYQPGAHALALVSAGDRRTELEQRAVGQAWIARAPAVFVIAGQVGKLAGAGDRAGQFLGVEAGAAAQGFFLQAEALGLGSTFVGGFRPRDAHAVLGLPEAEEVIGLLPVGRRP